MHIYVCALYLCQQRMAPILTAHIDHRTPPRSSNRFRWIQWVDPRSASSPIHTSLTLQSVIFNVVQIVNRYVIAFSISLVIIFVILLLMFFCFLSISIVFLDFEFYSCVLLRNWEKEEIIVCPCIYVSTYVRSCYHFNLLLFWRQLAQLWWL